MELSYLFSEIGIELSENQIQQFDLYTSFLLSENKKMNLTAITDIEDIYLKHYVDSCLLLKCFMEAEESHTRVLKCFDISDNTEIIDVGAGAGFPSIPLKILNPALSFTLLDSQRKRVSFLEELVRILSLDNVKIIHARAEDAGHDNRYREQFDISIARAVAPLPVLMEYCVPFVKTGGIFVAFKGKEAASEMDLSLNAQNVLGLDLIKTCSFTLPFSNNLRNILLYKKNVETLKPYPRKAGKPAKSPL